MDTALISETLSAAADKRLASLRSKELRPLRGVRGVPDGVIARAADAAWSRESIQLPRDAEALHALFLAAWEDGLVAIGLVAATVPEDPAAAEALARRWLALTDDFGTADALGSVLWAGSRLAQNARLLADDLPDHRSVDRALVAAVRSALAIPLEGPAAAPLRARLGLRQVAWVPDPRPDEAWQLLDRLARQPDPHVQRSLRRLIRDLAALDREAVLRWAPTVRGGLPRLLADEVRALRGGSPR